MGNIVAIDGIKNLANNSMLNALHNIEEAKRYFNKKSAENYYKTCLLNAQYNMGKYHAYMGVLEQMDFESFSEMWKRDEKHMDDVTKGIELIYREK